MKRVVEIDRHKLVEAMTPVLGKAKYGLGRKWAIDAQPAQLIGKPVDCSGFVRWLLHQASGGQVTMPDGSWHQRNWCHDQGFADVNYAEASKCDSRLRIAFMLPEMNHSGEQLRPGHVWLIISGKTIESCGGKGPTRRAWNTPTLYTNADACFVLTDPLPW